MIFTSLVHDARPLTKGKLTQNAYYAGPHLMMMMKVAFVVLCFEAVEARKLPLFRIISFLKVEHLRFRFRTINHTCRHTIRFLRGEPASM